MDTSPIVAGSSAKQALHNTLELAQLTDRLGYHRYWIPEHHSMRGVASAEPAVLAAAIASATTRLRVGAGGVLLPNHPPLMVAERWGMLTALHPGRIDLGIGRAPGGPPSITEALRRPHGATSTPAHTAALEELLGYFEPEPQPQVRAVPADDNRPDIWLLGSTSTSAQLAAERGLPYANAHHLNPDNALHATQHYRAAFQPTGHLPEPTTLVSVAVICAATDTDAEWLAGSTRMKALSRHRGQRILLPSPEHAAAELPPLDRAELATYSPGLITGSPDTVHRQLRTIATQTRTSEVMITTPIHDHEQRLRSYELLIGAFQ